MFIGGTRVGGADDTFAAFESGKLQELLRANHVAFEDKVSGTLYSLMPGWAQKRRS